MKSITKYAIIIWFIINCIPIYAQTEDLQKDTKFFEKQLKSYQKWLDFSGFGNVLKTCAIDVESNQVHFHLTLRFGNRDSLAQAWAQLKTDFEAESNLTLEEHLFYRMTHLTELQPEQAFLEIFDTYASDHKTHFSISISGDKKGVHTDTYILPTYIGKIEEADLDYMHQPPTSWAMLRSVVRPVEILHADLSKCKRLSTTQVRDFLNKNNVYKQIIDYAEAKYKAKGGRILLIEHGRNLRFEVINLRREVLTDKANPTLAKMLKYLGYEVNWVRREMLIFTVGFRETPAGVVLQCEIQGKYGSGFYENVKRGAYIEMEPEFTNYLEQYADNFAREVYTQLTK